MRYLLLIGAAGLLFGQGTDPKKTAEDYEVHAQAKNAAVGAEFMVHGYSRGEQMFIAPDFLVVEVALYPPKGETFEIHNSDFTLRINGKKDVLHAEAPNQVVAEEKHPEWNQPPGVMTTQGTAGEGNHGVILGGPPANPNNFPGSQQPGTGLPPRVEIPRDNPSGIEKQPMNAGELLMETALVEGTHHSPISGFIYFPYRGKMNAIKTLELLYQDTALKLK
jgi:hypothetical protein